MKTPIILLIIFFLASCGKNKTTLDGYVTYINYDTLSENSDFNNSIETDSLNDNQLESIVNFTVDIDSTKYYVVEGDMLMTEYEYTQYKLALLVGADEVLAHEKLVGEIRNGKVVKWPENHIIKYCITKNSFQTAE